MVIMTGELLVAAGMLAVITVAPGPDMAVVTRQVVSGGRGEGLRTTLGIILGLCMWGASTALGLSALLAASPTAFTVVTYAGAAYLVYLGVRSFIASRDRKSTRLNSSHVAISYAVFCLKKKW